jgi:hypothetical protein
MAPNRLEIEDHEALLARCASEEIGIPAGPFERRGGKDRKRRPERRDQYQYTNPLHVSPEGSAVQ